MSEAFLQSQIFKELVKSSYKEVIPLTTLIELTNRCNEKCIHCYVDQQASEVLSLAHWKDILDQLSDLGCLILTISGGDPLLYKHFKEVYIYAHKKKFAIRLFTNGLLLDDEIYDLLNMMKPLDVQFSIYGHNAKLHDSITRINGSFEKTCSAIRRVVGMGIPAYAKCSWLKQNANYSQEIYELSNSLGAIFRGNVTVIPARNSEIDVTGCRLTDTQLEKVITWNWELNNLNSNDVYANLEDLDNFNNSDNYLCGAGIINMRIAANGKVYGCTQFETEAGDTKTDSISTIWNLSKVFSKFRKYKKRDVTVCKNCEVRSFCFRCPGLALKENDDILGCYSEVLRHANIRQKMIKKTHFFFFFFLI